MQEIPIKTNYLYRHIYVSKYKKKYFKGNTPYNIAILSLNLIFHFCSYKNVSHLLFLNIDFISETNQSTRPIIVAAWPTSQPLPALFSPL